MNDRTLWPKIVYFDGVCNLCNSTVDFLIKADKKKKLKFASLQSGIAEGNLPVHLRENPANDTVIFMEGDKIYTRSTAILKLLCSLGFPWNLSSVFYLIPQAIRDKAYDYIAKKRYGWFGKREHCRMPDDDNRDRMLG